MAFELKVGQIWKNSEGVLVGLHKGVRAGFPFRSLYLETTGCGRAGSGVADHCADGSSASGRYGLIELIRDEHGFTIWCGGEQPAETKGRKIEYRMRKGDVGKSSADFLRWWHDNEPLAQNDIVAYKIVDTPVAQAEPEQITTDAAALAAETLSALGWRFDGQAWAQEPADTLGADTREHTGGSVSYYQVDVAHPTTDGRAPYTAECNDLIEALQMNYAEANVLKALWRICAARLGRSKRGYDDGVYDAEKIGFFGERVLVQQRREAGK